MTRYIDADVTLKHIDEYYDLLKRMGKPSRGMIAVMQNIKTIVNSLPTVDAEPVRHGKWKCTYSPNGFLLEQTCSECGLTFEEPSGVDYNYCPNCGADMRGEEEWTK